MSIATLAICIFYITVKCFKLLPVNVDLVA